MPQTQVIFYQEDENIAPVWDWLAQLRGENRDAFNKCWKAIALLEAMGHELRRPHADILRDGVYELRIKFLQVNYRILYFFDGRTAAVLACGFAKETKIPPVELNRAIARKNKYVEDRGAHTFKGRKQ